MSWLRTSPLRASFSRQLSRPLDAATKCDPSACYESFCKHWQQAEEIIERTQGTNIPTHDDVLGVVSHLEHLVTLLLLEIRHKGASDDAADLGAGGACLQHLLSENLLDKLYEWGNCTGRYLNAVRLEQMKLYSLLVTHSGQQLLCAEPFLRPLLKLLSGFRAELLPVDIEARLVCLLGQLCVVLMQNTKFVDLFFFTSKQEPEGQSANFVPVALLLSFVHREGPLGQQARAALLLCAAISAKNVSVAEYIAHRSNVCPLLATGLSGLYCLLPRNIDITQPDWHRLTPDDVNDINKLGLFMNSLEFCNAVAQVAHPLIQQQLLDFLYQGFLLPVMGPALLQNKRGQTTTKARCLQSGVDEQVAAIAYLELVLRSVSEPGLLKSLVKFLMDSNYDGANILDCIIPLIDGPSRLSIVTISLLETLVDLNCEDLMLELVLKYLMAGNHLMVSHRRRSLTSDVHCRATGMLLNLSPECCTTRPPVPIPGSRRSSATGSRKPSISSLDHNMSSLGSVGENSTFNTPQKCLPQSMFGYGMHANESLYGNYHAYLCEARRKILSCTTACKKWSSKYDGHSDQLLLPKPHDKVISVVKDFQLEHSNLIKESSFTDNDEGLSELSTNTFTLTNKEEDSLHSIGESSGYESFKYRGDDHHGTSEEDQTHLEDDSNDFAEESFWKSVEVMDKHFTIENVKKVQEKASKNQLKDVNIGPLMKTVLAKLCKLLDNDVHVNLRLTGLLSRLAVYPLPILRSFLLAPWIVFQPSITSLYQILVSLKQQIDESIRNESECLRLVEEAQAFLIDREIRLTNARKNAIESAGKAPGTAGPKPTVPLATQFTQNGVQYQNSDIPSQTNNGTWDQQPSTMQPMSINEQPFKRNEPKRQSLSSSFTSLFSRKVTSGGISGSTGTSHLPQLEPASRQYDSPTYSQNTEDNLWQSTNLRRVIINAIILDEWLRELGALAQEHAVNSISDLVISASCELDSTPAQTKIL